MFYMESEIPESEFLKLFQESDTITTKSAFREQLLDPIVDVLKDATKRKKYIDYGNSFLEENSDMLAKEYPTTRVIFPRKYVDGVLDLFGFTVKSIKEVLKQVLKEVREDGLFHTIMENPTNVVHSIVLIYSDASGNRYLRDSARQQMSLSIYSAVYKIFFPKQSLNESVMAYTYLNDLNNTWSIVRAGNVITWLGDLMDTSYEFWRTKLDLNTVTMAVITGFLGRVRTSYWQALLTLSKRYYNNLDKGNLIGDDLKGDEDYVETKSYTKLRENLMRKIKHGDELYTTKSDLYPAIARLKNVKTDTLFEYSKKIDHKDIGWIMDNIFYVFLVKEGNSVNDINSSKYIGRITNLPTAIDRAIQGKPVILPLSEKYKTDANIVKAHICLVATYILKRINDVTK